MAGEAKAQVSEREPFYSSEGDSYMRQEEQTERLGSQPQDSYTCALSRNVSVMCVGTV